MAHKMVLQSEKANKFVRTARMSSGRRTGEKRLLKRTRAVCAQNESNNSWNSTEHAVLTICCAFIQLVLMRFVVLDVTSARATTLNVIRIIRSLTDRPMD